VVAAGACEQPAVAPPSAPVSASAAASAPRRPDAVVVEPPPAVPPPSTRADAHGVVALREPLGGDVVTDLVQAFADAWQRESLDAMTALLTQDAGPIDARARGRTALIEMWRQRLHAHEYGRLSGVQLVRADRIERWSWDELAATDAPARPPEMRPSELFVRVPLEVTRVAGERLFGDAMLMLLRREEGRYRIAAYGEEP
jgi:hypothetical protein